MLDLLGGGSGGSGGGGDDDDPPLGPPPDFVSRVVRKIKEAHTAVVARLSAGGAVPSAEELRALLPRDTIMRSPHKKDGRAGGGGGGKDRKDERSGKTLWTGLKAKLSVDKKHVVDGEAHTYACEVRT